MRRQFIATAVAGTRVNIILSLTHAESVAWTVDRGRTGTVSTQSALLMRLPYDPRGTVSFYRFSCSHGLHTGISSNVSMRLRRLKMALARSWDSAAWHPRTSEKLPTTKGTSLDSSTPTTRRRHTKSSKCKKRNSPHHRLSPATHIRRLCALPPRRVARSAPRAWRQPLFAHMSLMASTMPLGIIY